MIVADAGPIITFACIGTPRPALAGSRGTHCARGGLWGASRERRWQASCRRGTTRWRDARYTLRNRQALAQHRAI